MVSEYFAQNPVKVSLSTDIFYMRLIEQEKSLRYQPRYYLLLMGVEQHFFLT